MNLKHAFAAAILALTAGPAPAQERPNASAMTCASAADLVRSRGEVVFSTGEFGFDRVVRDNGFCSNDEVTRPAFERTSDQRSCFAGYLCRSRDREGRD